jgi:hypothetical protein
MGNDSENDTPMIISKLLIHLSITAALPPITSSHSDATTSDAAGALGAAACSSAQAAGTPPSGGFEGGRGVPRRDQRFSGGRFRVVARDAGWGALVDPTLGQRGRGTALASM